MDKKDLVKEKTKIEVETEIVNEMIKPKEVGDRYSDVIRRLLINQKKKMKWDYWKVMEIKGALNRI